MLPAACFKEFFVTADVTGQLANDQVLGSKGKGWYGIRARAAAAADASFTVNDGKSDVLATIAIQVRAAAVTYPELKNNEDSLYWVYYEGEGPTLPLNILDGTNAEIALQVQYGGRGSVPVRSA